MNHYAISGAAVPSQARRYRQVTGVGDLTLTCSSPTSRDMALGLSFASLWSCAAEAEPRALDMSFSHPATDTEIADFAERIL